MDALQEPLPVNEEALGLVFRTKFIDYMTEAYQSGTLSFPGIIAPIRNQKDSPTQEPPVLQQMGGPRTRTD